MLEADHPTAYGSLPIVEAQAQARVFALKAHQLDPNLGDAYASLGFLSLSLAPQAEPYFRKAVELSPQTPEFHRWHGETLLNERRYDEAVAEFKRAVEIDPLWGLSYDHLIGALYMLGRKDEARQYLNRFLALSTDQRAKLLLLRSMADNDSRVADQFRISLQLFRTYPQERQVRFGFASILAELGERRRALDLMKEDRIAAAALSSDWPSLAAASNSLGSEYWNVSKFWNAGNLLVQSGHGETIAKMYDRDRGLVASGEVNGQDLATPSTVLALRQAGRAADADRVFAQMKSLNSARPHGGLLGDDKAMMGIIIAALGGDREGAIRGLDDLSRRNPLMLMYIPAQALRYDPTFAPLASDPRFAVIEDRVRVATNNIRQSFGMPPISREAWASDPRILLTKN
jgi:tetratricopeptide (TPR) repeat protein